MGNNRSAVDRSSNGFDICSVQEAQAKSDAWWHGDRVSILHCCVEDQEEHSTLIKGVIQDYGIYRLSTNQEADQVTQWILQWWRLHRKGLRYDQEMLLQLEAWWS